jgi:valyl-tRNA synthetase
LELIKPRLYSEKNPEERVTVQTVATHVLKSAMSLLHPYIPFITEEIWQQLKNFNEESVVISQWPSESPQLTDETAERKIALLQRIISAVRTIRSEMNVPPGKKARLIYRTQDQDSEKLLTDYDHYLMQLAGIESIQKLESDSELKSTAAAVIEKLEIFIPLSGLIDLDVEKQRMKKEMDRMSGQIKGLEKKLNNSDFLTKAPEKVVQQEKEKLSSFQDKLNKLTVNFNRIN